MSCRLIHFAISEGNDRAAQDKATIDNQIKTKQIKVYVYNSQNAAPDVQVQVDEAKAAVAAGDTYLQAGLDGCGPEHGGGAGWSSRRCPLS